MKIAGRTILVTGANRGLGKAFVAALSAAGAARIYAASRRPTGLDHAQVITELKLDITRPDDVASAAAQCGDIDLLINNAGVAAFTPALGVDSIENARIEMETNYFGTLAMCRAFAPVLGKNGGGAIVNILSVVSWFNAPMQGTYCASKAAQWSLTKAIRFELRAQRTFVAGVYAGYIDTDMAAHLDLPKSSPRAVVERVLQGIENDEQEICADDRAREIRAELLRDAGSVDAGMQEAWDQFKARNVRA